MSSAKDTTIPPAGWTDDEVLAAGHQAILQPTRWVEHWPLPSGTTTQTLHQATVQHGDETTVVWNAVHGPVDRSVGLAAAQALFDRHQLWLPDISIRAECSGMRRRSGNAWKAWCRRRCVEWTGDRPARLPHLVLAGGLSEFGTFVEKISFPENSCARADDRRLPREHLDRRLSQVGGRDHADAQAPRDAPGQGMTGIQSARLGILFRPKEPGVCWWLPAQVLPTPADNWPIARCVPSRSCLLPP
jgi:hypothetical protein